MTRGETPTRDHKHDVDTPDGRAAAEGVPSDAATSGAVDGDVPGCTETEEELARSRDKYKALVESSGDFIWEVDAGGHYTYCSPQIEQLWGIKPPDMVGKSLMDFMPDDARIAASEVIEEMVRSPRPFHGLETPAYDGRGGLIYVEISGVPFFDRRGTLLGFRGITRDITERRLVDEALAASEARLEFLLRLTDALRSVTEAADVADITCRLLGEQLKASRVAFADVAGEREFLIRGQYTNGLSAPPPGPYPVSEFGGERLLTVFRAGQPSVVENHDSDARWAPERKAFASLDIVSEASVPVVKGGRVVATLAVHAVEPRLWTQEELQLITEVAERTWAAAQRVKTQEDVHESLVRIIELAKREETLKKVTEQSSALLPPDVLASRIAEEVALLFGAAQAQIRLLSEDRRMLSSGGAYDPNGFLQQVGDMSIDADTETAAAFRAGEQRIAEDLPPTITEASRRNASDVGIRAYVLMPIFVGDQAIGVFYMAWAEPRTFTDGEISFMQAVTSQFSVGLQNARLYEAQRRRRHRIEAIHGVLEAGVSSLDVHQAAQKAIDHLASHRDIDLASVWLTQGDHLGLAAQVGYPAEYDRPIPLTEPLDAVEVLKSGVRIVVQHPQNPAVLEVYRRMGIDLGSYVALPLVGRGRPIGVLAFAWHDPQEFTQYDLQFFDSVADEIAVVLENARLFEGERNLAETLQETLVVLPTHVHGVEFSRAYESATHESGHVGGDFVDVFEAYDRTVGISLGDVSGKGIDAAVTTSLVRNTLRVHAIDRLTVDQIVGKANVVTQRFIEADSFVTLWFGLLDTHNGELRYVAAGHPPALVLGTDGSVAPLLCSDPFIGAFTQARFQARPALLSPGDRLILYSDGVIEARSLEGEFFGESRLRELVSQLRQVPTAEMSAAIMRAVADFSHGVLRDDAAVLVVEWLGRDPRD